MSTFASSEDPDKMWHFISVCKFANDKIDFQGTNTIYL